MIYAQPPAKRLCLNKLKPSFGTGKHSSLEQHSPATYCVPESGVSATSAAKCPSASFASHRQEDTQFTRIAGECDERPSMPSTCAFGENGLPANHVTSVDRVSLSSRTLSEQASLRRVRDSDGWSSREQSNGNRIDGEQAEQDLYCVELDSN